MEEKGGQKKEMATRGDVVLPARDDILIKAVLMGVGFITYRRQNL